MQIGTEGDRLELKELERLGPETQTPGDVRLDVTLVLKEFRGHYSEVWVAQPDLAQFVEHLRAVVTKDRYTARLESMSPGELILEMRAREVSGEHKLMITLGRHQFCGDSYMPVSLSGGVAIESNQLDDVLKGFEAMLSGSDPS